MDPHTIFVNANTGVVSGSLTTVTAPTVKVLLGQRLHLKVAFHVGGVIAAITNYTADSMRLAMKKSDDLDSPTSLLPLGAWTTTGSTTATRYELVVEADSDQLQTAIGDLGELITRAQLTWEISTQAEPRLSYPFDITVVNSPARTDDGAPDTTGAAAFAWLLTQIAAGVGLKLTSDPEALLATLDIERTFGRVTTDTNAYSGAWTTLFSIPVEAGATYQLDLSLFASFANDASMRVYGELISGATAHGLWAPRHSTGISSSDAHAFTEATYNELVTNAEGAALVMAAAAQRFLIITTSTAGNLLIKARSTAAADGVIKAGSHWILTKLT